MPGTWSEEDDRKLWSMRFKPSPQLASTFGKTNGAIRARLKHLQDPYHNAYKRRVGSSTSGGRSKSNFIDLTGAGASPLTFECHTTKVSKKPQQRIDPSSLNSDQNTASGFIFSGGNAFLTGAAGVGKSYLLNYLIQGLRDKYERDGSRRPLQRQNDQDREVVVAAATGIAATHIDGVTIHSWAGVRLGTGGARVLVPRVLQNRAACQRWRKARVLILDEVSMIDGMFFEALDAIGREVRGCRNKPFGGIQLVLSGDFFQLPPISLTSCGFAFESLAWGKAAIKMVELRTVVRQSGDRAFINLLNQLRVGKCGTEITQALEACHISKKPLPVDGIVPTKLYCTNRNVDEENNRNLNHLPGKEILFRATDTFKGRYSREVQRNLTQTMGKKMPFELRLKVGAQVILTRNMPNCDLVNGSRGVVSSFRESNSDSKENNCGCCNGAKKLSPVVHFSNGVKMMVTEESIFQGGSLGAVTRSQLPLKLAWSLTVHKSQGMTIECAELQLDDAFDFGQVYVALSRVTSLEGLWVRGGRITQSVVKAHPKVKSFYQHNGSAVMANQSRYAGISHSWSGEARRGGAVLANHSGYSRISHSAEEAERAHDESDDVWALFSVDD